MTVKRVCIGLASLALLLVTLMGYVKQTLFVSHLYGFSDFFKFYQSLLFHFSGQDIYSHYLILSHWPPGKINYLIVNGNLNPPFFLLFLLPLHVFNYATAYVIWNAISVIFLAAGLLLALRPFPQWHKNTLPVLALFFLYLPCLGMLACGQITSVLLVVIAAAWLFARKNRDNTAGIMIGLACVLKLFCGLFLIYFLCLKRVRVVLIALAILLLFSVAGIWIFGIQSYLSYHALLKGVDWYTASWNVSFTAFFMRLFSNTEGNSPVVVLPWLATVCTVICSGLLLAYVIAWWSKWGSIKFDEGFSLVIASMLLLSPLGWAYYFPLLIIPYLVLVSDGNDWVHMGACVLLFLSTLMGVFLSTGQISTVPQIFLTGGIGVYVLLGFVILLSQTFPKDRQLSENLWIMVYITIFIPSLISLGVVIRGQF